MRPSHRSAPRLLAILFLTFTAQASSQSLADVARIEEERRKQATSGRVLTNDDLARIDTAPARSTAEAAPSTPVPPQGSRAGRGDQSEPAGAASAAGTVVEGRPKRGGKYWRAKAQDLRDQLAQANTRMAGLDSRLAELKAAPETPAIQSERAAAVAALAKARAAVHSVSEDIERMMRRARVENVPPDWVR